MEYSCEYCPPAHFKIHDKCHKEVLNFLENLANARQDNENINGEWLTSLSIGIQATLVIHSTSKTKKDFKKYYHNLKKFNKTVETILRESELARINRRGGLRVLAEQN